MFAIKDKWVWDFWFVQENDIWHMYYLMAPKSLPDPDLRHWNVSIGHATSKDLINWEDRGKCFEPSSGPSWDDYTTWTGSVIRNGNEWHLFYTGTSKAEQGKKQRIGHAISKNLHNWQRVGKGLALDIDPNHYEEYTPGWWHDRAMRDPYVIKNPNDNGWLMYYTARIPGTNETNEGGAIGLAKSSNLNDWEHLPPAFSGGFGQLEVPQVLEINGKWYCLFTTMKDHWSENYKMSYNKKGVTGTHYLISDHPEGPWKIAPGEFLDGQDPCRRYSGKIVQVGGTYLFISFLDQGPNNEFLGAIDDPLSVTITNDGLLKVNDV